MGESDPAADVLDHIGMASREGEYLVVSPKDVEEEKYRSSVKACHCMLFARTKEKIFGTYDARAAVLMQMRFDGHLGFPGGCVDPGEDPVEAINREMSEEMGTSRDNSDDKSVVCLKVTNGHHLVTHWSADKCLLLYFYVVEVDMDQLKRMEKRALEAPDYGSEVQGVLRVPLYTMSDGYRGFPSFLRNQFIGNSRQQLFAGLEAVGIMNEEEIAAALRSQPVFYSRPPQENSDTAEKLGAKSVCAIPNLTESLSSDV